VYVVARALNMTWPLYAKCASAGCAARDGIPSNHASATSARQNLPLLLVALAVASKRSDGGAG
jgi:hypothetical protein